LSRTRRVSFLPNRGIPEWETSISTVRKEEVPELKVARNVLHLLKPVNILILLLLTISDHPFENSLRDLGSMLGGDSKSGEIGHLFESVTPPSRCPEPSPIPLAANWPRRGKSHDNTAIFAIPDKRAIHHKILIKPGSS